jgi:hypothetical protein
MINRHHQKSDIDDLKGAFLASKEWNSFHLLGTNLVYLHLEDFLKYECELYSKQPLTQPQHKIIVAYCTLNHRLAIEIGWRPDIGQLSLSPHIID